MSEYKCSGGVGMELHRRRGKNKEENIMAGYFEDGACRRKIEDKAVETVTVERKDKKKAAFFTKKWWDGFMMKLIVALTVFAFVVCTIGVLAIPVVLAFVYSPLWVLCYAAYMLILLLFVTMKG